MIDINSTRISHFIDKDYHTLAISIARSLFAISLLLNLLFNSDSELFIELKSNLGYTNFEFYSIFQIFNNLLISRIIIFLILVAVLSGYFPAITSIFHSWATFSYMFSSVMIEGGDQIAHLIVFLFVPILIFDRRKNHWQKSEPLNNFYKNTVCFFADLLIRVQFFIIYFFASVGKFNSPEWKNGTSLYYWFSNKVFGLNDFTGSIVLPMLKNPYFLTISTWSVLLVELIIAYSVFSKSNNFKEIVLYLGLFFHLFIGLFFGLWSFFFAMAGLLTYVLFNSRKYES